MSPLFAKEARLRYSHYLHIGPGTIRAREYGVSLELPHGWLAAEVAGEIIGIEPLNHEGGRIFVVSQKTSLAETKLSMALPTEVGANKLSPVTQPIVQGDIVVAQYIINNPVLYGQAYAATTVTRCGTAIEFIGLSHVATEDEWFEEVKDTVNYLAASVKMLITKVDSYRDAVIDKATSELF